MFPLHHPSPLPDPPGAGHSRQAGRCRRWTYLPQPWPSSGALLSGGMGGSLGALPEGQSWIQLCSGSESHGTSPVEDARADEASAAVANAIIANMRNDSMTHLFTSELIPGSLLKRHSRCVCYMA